MKTEKNILIAFLLNISFSILEFIGGVFSNSVAIMSDAIHDLGDATSIGVSYFLERKSKKGPDEKYTYGYIRYSVMGSLITTVILLVGSLIVIFNSIKRIINPVEVNYNGMLIFAIFGVIINFGAAYFTREGDSLNQKSVNLHMLEDVLGWVVVLIGAIIMKFTDISLIDPIMSICVSSYILINTFKNFQEIVELFLEKTPKGISISELEEHITEIKGVIGVHHIHVWSIDGYSNFATMHIITNEDSGKIKKKVKEELKEHGIGHSTIEIEKKNEHCKDEECHVEVAAEVGGHHHHH